MGYLSLLASGFLGWGLGANDSANVFGIAVYTKVVKYLTAILLTGVFVILGAFMDGHQGIGQLSSYAYGSGITNNLEAFLVMIGAAVTVSLMTFLKLPVSTSQSVVGAIIGFGILKGMADFSAGTKFFGAWVLTPIGSLIVAFAIFSLISSMNNRMNRFKYYEISIKLGYLGGGIFGAYALGANNVANVTALFAGELGLINSTQAVLIGGFAIALGVLTFSKPVMSTVGERLVPLSPIAGMVVVIASSLTVFIYAKIGIPVSTSQAVVGAIVGVGFKMGVSTINGKMLKNILFGWLMTPTIAGVISYLLSKLFL